MLQIFIGTDREKAKNAASEFAAKESARLGAVSVRVDALERVIPEDIIHGGSLFGGKRVVILDGFLGAGVWHPTEGTIEGMRKNQDAFVILEEALPEEIENSFKKGEIVLFDTKEEEDRGWSKKHYALADAFIEGKRKEAWVLYQDLLRKGVRPEELHSVLLWAVKNMMLSLRSPSAKEANLHAFVYGKSRRAAEKMGERATGELLRNVIVAYHNARRGGDLEMLLEKLVLR